jgi:nitroimidazol reductase NimA-like FMN-containing flavoprotein (pyridoxamine 5'-phosphate oxidase superfamily)
MKVIGPAAGRALGDARRIFKDVPLVHVGTLMPDGTPHVVPLWFVWLEEEVVVSCRAASQVWANLRHDQRVALEIERGRAWAEHAGILVRGRAEPVPAESTEGKRALSAWFEKYRDDLAGPGFAAYTEQVIEPRLFRVRPASVSTWRHGPPARS